MNKSISIATIAFILGGCLLIDAKYNKTTGECTNSVPRCAQLHKRSCYDPEFAAFCCDLCSKSKNAALVGCEFGNHSEMYKGQYCAKAVAPITCAGQCQEGTLLGHTCCGVCNDLCGVFSVTY